MLSNDSQMVAERDQHASPRRYQGSSNLPPSAQRLLHTCIALRTTNTKILATHLKLSPATIRTVFQRALQALDVHSRYEALKAAEERGWL